jgi:hypothetical protein
VTEPGPDRPSRDETPSRRGGVSLSVSMCRRPPTKRIGRGDQLQLLLLQLDPDHELPDHELPLQLLPDHELPDHELPDQLLLLQLEPDHELPDHELPDQELPFHRSPDHELPSASSFAMASASKSWPKMSCSPERTTSSRVRCSEPRASSSEPVPVDDLGREPFLVNGVVVSILARSISP